MGEDGTVNLEVARQRAPANVPKDQVESVINKCKDSASKYYSVDFRIFFLVKLIQWHL